MGYTIWYMALPRLLSIQAAMVQLCVPIIAAMGGVLILSEPLTARTLLAGSAILFAIFLVILGNRRAARRAQDST